MNMERNYRSWPCNCSSDFAIRSGSIHNRGWVGEGVGGGASCHTRALNMTMGNLGLIESVIMWNWNGTECNTGSCWICFHLLSIPSCAGYRIDLSCILRSAQGLFWMWWIWYQENGFMFSTKRKNMFEELANSVSDPDSLITDRIQHFRLNTDQDPGFWWSNIGKNLQLKEIWYF